MKRQRSTAGNIGLVMVIMVISRLLSLVSVQVYLAVFGTGGNEINIYSYALSVPNILFTCFGTALSTVVIPLYAGLKGRGEDARAARFAHNLLTISILLTAVLVLAGEALSPLIPRLTDYATPERGYDFAVKALMILFPVMFFYTLNYVFQGMLQSVGRFFMPAFVSVPSSLVVIGYTLLLSDRFGVGGLLVATFIGLALQALILAPSLWRSGYRYRFVLDLRDEDMRTAIRLTPPVLLGTSAYQVNMLFNITLAANYNNRLTLLTYTQQLVLYSTLAFVYSVTAVIYPKLSMLHARGDLEGYRETLARVIRSMAFLLLPATAGLVALRVELVDLLARWGKVTHADVRLAGILLALYAAGIAGIGLKELLDRAFYAARDTRTPAVNSVVMMIINILASLGLTRVMGIAGIPLAYSLASLAGGTVLLILVRRRTGFRLEPEARKALIRMAGASVLVFAAAAATAALLKWALPGEDALARIARLGIPAAAGVACYATVTLGARLEEARQALHKITALVRSPFRDRSRNDCQGAKKEDNSDADLPG